MTSLFPRRAARYKWIGVVGNNYYTLYHFWLRQGYGLALRLSRAYLD